MIGDPGSEHHRTRVGFLFLAAGVLLLIWAWGSWFYRASHPPESTVVSADLDDELGAAPRRRGRGPEPDKLAQALPAFLAVGVVLVLVFLFGAFAITRFSRRYREVLGHKRAPPSDASDVWARHRVPEYQDDEDEFV